MAKKDCPRIIGISGFARSGKDTFGKAIISYQAIERKQQYKRVAFGDQVKHELEEFVQKHYGFSCIRATDSQKAIIRTLMIGHGESKRAQKEDYWIYCVKPIVESCFGHGVGVVITDVRYLNEVDYIKSNRGIILHIKREGIEPPSEIELKNTTKVKEVADFTLRIKTHETNHSSKIYEKVKDFMKEKFK